MKNMTKEEIDQVSDMEVYEELRAVIDPELFVNIVDLGLIYGLELSKDPFRVDVNLTLTSKGCPMGDTIMQDIDETLQRCFPGVEVHIELVWEPAWSMEFISEEGRMELNGGY